MKFDDMKCNDFVKLLSTKEPVPGGGGAMALVAAVGTALGNMVGALTTGKKKYADVEEDIINLIERATRLQAEFLEFMEKDAEAFRPLSKAYGLPAATETEKTYKDKVMEECLKTAGNVPMELMEKCCRAIDITEEFAIKGSKLAISDAGCSVVLLKSALEGAALNVFINTKYMKDRAYADEMNNRAEGLLKEYGKKADTVYERVKGDLK